MNEHENILYQYCDDESNIQLNIEHTSIKNNQIENTDKLCKNCKFCRKLKHDFRITYGYEESLCCVLLNSVVIETKKDFTCEEFTYGEDNV